MLTDSSKVFLPFAGVGLALGLFYAAASSDRAGATLLLFLLVAAGVVGISLLRYRDNEVAPPVAPDAPAAEPRPVRPEYMPKSKSKRRRYQPPPRKKPKPSPRWFGFIILGCWGVGVIFVILNYLSIMPGLGPIGHSPSNGWLFSGLGLIALGFLLATQWR